VPFGMGSPLFCWYCVMLAVHSDTKLFDRQLVFFWGGGGEPIEVRGVTPETCYFSS